MICASLDENIAGSQSGFSLLHYRANLSFQNDCIIDCIRFVHAWVDIRTVTLIRIIENLAERGLKLTFKFLGVFGFGRKFDHPNNCAVLWRQYSSVVDDLVRFVDVRRCGSCAPCRSGEPLGGPRGAFGRPPGSAAQCFTLPLSH